MQSVMNPPGCICRYLHKSDPTCPYEPKAPVSSNERCLTANPPCHFCEHAREVERLTRERQANANEIQRLYGLVNHWYGETGRLRTALERCRLASGLAKAEIIDAALSGDPNSAPETTASPQAPIVKVIIENGKAAYTTIYAPGLPDGTHDLYCEPEAVAPMMRAEAQTSGECPVCLGERRVTIGRRAIGQDSRVKALQMMYVEQPCPMCNAQKADADR